MRVVDLFCGCGGMSLGFLNAGFEIIEAFDNWDPAIRTYEKNFTHPVRKADLADESMINVISELTPEIIIGGPPCQDFSSAGHRDETLGRAELSKTYTDIVANAKPKYFVMENVPRIRVSKTYQYVREKMKKVGYGLTEKILDASYCGVPQKRKRLFLIGCLGAEDDFLLDYLNKNLASSPMSIYDYLGDSLGVEYYFRIPRSYNRRAVFSIYEPCQTIRGVDRPIPPNYKKHPQDPVEVGPLARALTPKERSFMQTFPENFVFEENKTNTNQMIGNAVPVKLAEYVANAILQYDKSKGKDE
ncbi:DNA cytosine methyltransferase [Amedibacillus dolichus]|uniref:DNA cytosine methyltransferase n=1 Tax=Amedibacillus dolichus TaxID=31971 RepID=UPI00241DDEAF|nr:DNA cytosine methyltransferase [Amedibacillus dolichus]